MNSVIRHITRLFAVVAITLQVFLPAPMASAQHAHQDLSHIFCISGDSPNAEVAAAVQEWAKLVQGDEAPSHHDGGSHCPLCTLSHGAPLAEVTLPAVVLSYERISLVPRYEPGHVHKPQGPPVGVRGPPAHI